MSRWLRGRAIDGSLLVPLSWSVAALLVALLPHLWHFPGWISLLAISCASWRVLAEKRRWRFLPPVVRVLCATAAFFGILVVYSSINGVVPGTALLAVMAALKLLESWQRRDFHVVLFIACFLLLASVLREQAIWSLPYLLATLVLIFTAWLQVARLGPPLPVRQSAAIAGRTLASAAPLLLALWILFPRVPGPFWAVPVNSGQGSTGISDSISPGDISSLSQSNAVAFRAAFNGDIPPARDLYWRGPVMEQFQGRRWSVRERTGSREFPSSVTVSGQPYEYTLTMQPTNQSWLFALDVPQKWDLAGAKFTRTHQLVANSPLRNMTRLTVSSYTDFKIAEALSERDRAKLTDTDSNNNPRSRQLARSLRDQYRDDQQLINAVLRQFRADEFYYTLRPPALGKDSIDEFLFQTRRGFCEHYASAFAFLMRSAGIPARIVAGYQGGEVNPIGGFLVVRQSNAHAWTEVWLEDRGWVRVDPTAAVSALRIESGIDAALEAYGERNGRLFSGDWAADLEVAWDAINARWDDWVLGYGPETQRRFMQWLGMDDPNRTRLLIYTAIAALLCLAVFSWRLLRRFQAPPPDAEEAVYRSLLKKLNVETDISDTPSRVLERASDLHPGLHRELSDFVSSYQSVRFANRGSPSELQGKATALIRARRAARAKATRRLRQTKAVKRK